MELWQSIPKEFINFMLVILFSLSLGMEQHKQNKANTEKRIFGTDRTFTFFGLLGYILLLPSKEEMWPFLIGFIVIACFMMIFYLMRIREERQYQGDDSPIFIAKDVFRQTRVGARRGDNLHPLGKVSRQQREDRLGIRPVWIIEVGVLVDSIDEEDQGLWNGIGTACRRCSTQ